MAETTFAKWRAKVGMTQSEAAEALGVALTTVKQYESGKHLGTGKKMSPPEPVRKLMRAIANGIRVEPWPE
jgi:DNA-binding XRE family transcriptional regulator